MVSDAEGGLGSALPWGDMNQGLNLTDNGNLPVEEAREQLGEVSFLLPFSREIRSAMSMVTDIARIKKITNFQKALDIWLSVCYNRDTGCES